MGWVVCSGVEWWAVGRYSFGWGGGVSEAEDGGGEVSGVRTCPSPPASSLPAPHSQNEQQLQGWRAGEGWRAGLQGRRAGGPELEGWRAGGGRGEGWWVMGGSGGGGGG